MCTYEEINWQHRNHQRIAGKIDGKNLQKQKPTFSIDLILKPYPEL